MAWDRNTEMEDPLEGVLDLEDERLLLKMYYAGSQMPSPNGGFLIPLGVLPAEDGWAILLMECSASSLRYRIDIPKATRTERKKVRDVQADGDDPDCPRHGDSQRLVRVGKDLVCNLCGVAYGKV